MKEADRTSLVAIEPQAGHCGICRGVRLCRMADQELGRPVCPECFPAVVLADRVLWIAGWKGYGICRPQPGKLLDK